MNILKKLQPGIETLKQLDAYSKPIEDFRVKTVSGGTASVLCWLIIIILLIKRFHEFTFNNETVETIFVDTSRGTKLRINVDFIVPSVSCDYLALDAMDTSGEQHLHIEHNIFKRRLDLAGNPIEDPKKEETLGTALSGKNDTALAVPKCGSCYGAENPEKNITCCNTCEDVKHAYQMKRWEIREIDKIEQCQSTQDAEKIAKALKEGCQIYGYMEVNRVGGSFHIAPGQSFTINHIHVHDVQPFSSSTFNTSHIIRHLSFGRNKIIGKDNPLDNSESIATEGATMYQYYIKIVPTMRVLRDGSIFHSNQFSVTKHAKVVSPGSGDSGMPGIFFSYELSALMVKITDKVIDEQDVDANIRAGIYCVFFFFVIISVLAFPNGPFTRPHPAVWRIVFGLSVLYLMLLVFCLFQDYKTVKEIIYWFDPGLKHFHIDMDREYGVNCSVLTVENLWNHMDVFALAHFLGWAFKALLVRHLGILWAVSVMWEFTEIAFAHLLPNFVECWWDALILDVLLCNGLGIWVGLKICKMIEMREYKWVSIRDIHSTTGKIKRVMLQFTPREWMEVRWLDPSTTYMRFFAICQLVIFWQVCELNTFFLKHIFEMPPAHPLVYLRLLLVGIVVAPSIRQYYMYVTDPRCKRVGTQCWVYGAIMATEALLCIKNGKELFGQTQATNICIWLLLIFLLSCLCVYGCVVWHRYFQADSDFSRETSPCKSPTSEFSESLSESSPNPAVKRALLFSPENCVEDVKRRHVNGLNLQS